jgi:hypothetical protein
MPHTDSHRSKPALAPTIVILLASLLLAACGGSSKASSSSTASTDSSSSSASTATTPTRAVPPIGAGSAKLRSCLAKNGVTLPEGVGAGSAGQLPKGITQKQLQAALKKCSPGGSGGGGAGGPQRSQRLAKFAACMRQNGVKLPPPNTSGKGPVFDTTGLDTKGAAFQSAMLKCSDQLGR